MRTSYAWGLFFITASSLIACQSTEEPGGPGKGSACEVDADCSDGIYCNGSEVCEKDSTAANALGCQPGPQPCTAEYCDESEASCADVPEGACADVDGDGATDRACGGTDCDDNDPLRYPGNAEVCDADNVDEDCDPSSFGVLDEDKDGFVSTACCNGTLCGDDCGDDDAGVHRLVPEVCDGIDNNCSGKADEGVTVYAYPDADYDSYGDASVEPELLCSLPTGMADRAGDCDDQQPFLSPREIDVCNAVDDDCDGDVDEGAELRCDVGAIHADGGCVTSAAETETMCRNYRCDEGYWDCDGNPQNGCEADLCRDRFNCGTCGQATNTCSNGRPSPPSVFTYNGGVRDSAGAALGDATVSLLDSCQRTQAQANKSGAWSLDANGPHRYYSIEKSGYYPSIALTTWSGPSATNTRLFTPAEVEAWAKAEGIELDPKKGIILLTEFAPHDLNGEEFDKFSVNHHGTVLNFSVNVRPGAVKIQSRPGCQLTCSVGALTNGNPDYLNVHVQPGTITFVPFSSCGMSCVS